MKKISSVFLALVLSLSIVFAVGMNATAEETNIVNYGTVTNNSSSTCSFTNKVCFAVFTFEPAETNYYEFKADNYNSNTVVIVSKDTNLNDTDNIIALGDYSSLYDEVAAAGKLSKGTMYYIFIYCETEYQKTITLNVYTHSHIMFSKITKSEINGNKQSSSDGYEIHYCGKCDYETTKTIKRVGYVGPHNAVYTYDGKVKNPKCYVKYANKSAFPKSNYSVTLQSGRKNVGKYKITFKFKNNYTGTYTEYFTIKPKSTSLSKITKPAKKQIKVQWKKQATQTTGYQIQYSTSSKYTSGATKTVTVTKNTSTSKTIKSLKAKKKYYVRVRTYKTVKFSGKSTKIYSSWSKTKSVTTK